MQSQVKISASNFLDNRQIDSKVYKARQKMTTDSQEMT
jgi:hypothetical protein